MAQDKKWEVDLQDHLYKVGWILQSNDLSNSSSVLGGMYVGSAGGNMQPVFEITKQRYYNSKRTHNYQFIVTKAKKEGGADEAFIYQLNKATGTVDQQIQLMDKTPDYILNNIDSRVFLNEKNRVISCYQL